MVVSEQIVSVSARRHGVPERLARAIIHVESGGRCSATNRSARGVGQVLTKTAASVGVYGNLLDCSVGLEAMMRFLRKVIETHGTGCQGASAYNRGIFLPGRCTGYGRSVLSVEAREVRE